jgi:hypothetical protein
MDVLGLTVATGRLAALTAHLSPHTA